MTTSHASYTAVKNSLILKKNSKQWGAQGHATDQCRCRRCRRLDEGARGREARVHWTEQQPWPTLLARCSRHPTRRCKMVDGRYLAAAVVTALVVLFFVTSGSEEVCFEVATGHLVTVCSPRHDRQDKQCHCGWMCQFPSGVLSRHCREPLAPTCSRCFACALVLAWCVQTGVVGGDTSKGVVGRAAPA